MPLPSQAQCLIFQDLLHRVHICHLLGPLTFLRPLIGQSCREPKEGIGETPGNVKSHLDVRVSAECQLPRVHLGGDSERTSVQAGLCGRSAWDLIPCVVCEQGSASHRRAFGVRGPREMPCLSGRDLEDSGPLIVPQCPSQPGVYSKWKESSPCPYASGPSWRGL